MSTLPFEDVRLQYKSDDFGKPLLARVCWQKLESATTPRPIVIIPHAGGLVVGSCDIVPRPQIEHLTSKGVVLVIPNYRLAPQVTAQTAFGDVVTACEWATSALPAQLAAHDVHIDTSRVATYGHSIGGTMALHLAALYPDSIRAVAALYPSLYLFDKSSSNYEPYTKPPFGTGPDFTPTEEQWSEIKPSDHQVSAAPLAGPGTTPKARNLWQMHLLKHGQLMSVVQPDGKFGPIDPAARFVSVGAQWPPTLFVNPESDDIPGSGPEAIQRAVKGLTSSGAKDVKVIDVRDASHMFDLPPMVGTSDQGEKWQAVVKALDFLIEKL